jgi:uncharacterized membrane protein YheB (UPF0754 family)
VGKNNENGLSKKLFLLITSGKSTQPGSPLPVHLLQKTRKYGPTPKKPVSLPPNFFQHMNFWLFSLPLISAFIGWFTNWIAIKMLFHPKEPKKILGITFHGIFPKRQQQFAEKLGKLVSQELLSFEDIAQKITNAENIKKIMPQVESYIDHFLRVKLSEAMPVISMFIGDKTIAQLKEIFVKELEELFPNVMANYMGKLKEDLDLEKIVVNKVAAFSSDKLESILYQIMNKEFRFVEIIGGVLGFLIGVLQVLITVITS